MMTTTNIALVGAGKGGKALLNDLIKIPGVVVKYVCDVNPEAEGIVFAKTQGLKICSWNDIDDVLSDREIDLILEVTGKDDVFEELKRKKRPEANLLGAATTKILFHFLESQQRVTNELQDYKRRLEERIIERTERIEEANLELEKKIHEFEELNVKLKQINDSKTKYLLRATHQLKAPFAAIQSYADILLQGYVGELSDFSRRIVGKIKDRCDLLSAAIKEMLELANLNSCIEDNIKMEKISLSGIVTKVIDSFSTVLVTRNIRIEYSNSAEDDVIKCNKEQISILTANLLENAINYSHDNSVIRVGVGVNGGRAFLDVADDGIGIAGENIEKIFDEYFRGNNAAKKYDHGTGLGMAIVRRIADIHKCNIRIKSKIDEGTIISVLFSPRHS
jgi:two-component system, OmpR family, sensor kinase